MNVRITPGNVKGSLVIPASKSFTQRVFAAALLHKGISEVSGYGVSDDEKASLQIIRQLGAAVYESEGSVIIKSRGIDPLNSLIHCRESGLAARLFTPVAATHDQALTISGCGSLLKRPMNFFREYLPQLNVSVQQEDDHLPMIIKGPLQPRNIKVDGAVSSQFLTGLLFAYAFTAREEVAIEVNRLTSRPYIDLTLQVLRHYGKAVKNENYERFLIPSSGPAAETIRTQIEADWSSAGYWIVAGLIAGNLELKGLNSQSLQADKAIMNVVTQCGGMAVWKENILSVHSTATLNAFEMDATHCPDLFPILSVLATRCLGTSVIKGLHRLIHKESNRKESICTMLERLGADFRIVDDSLLIKGSSFLNAAVIPSFMDHRIAMAATIAALHANENVVIENAECVSKSYPEFFTHLQQLGIHTTVSA